MAHFKRAADAGHAWAQYNLGHLYLDGRGVARDPAFAFAYYLKAALQQHERAMNLLGRLSEEGWARRAIWRRQPSGTGVPPRVAIFAGNTTGPVCC